MTTPRHVTQVKHPACGRGRLAHIVLPRWPGPTASRGGTYEARAGYAGYERPPRAEITAHEYPGPAGLHRPRRLPPRHPHRVLVDRVAPGHRHGDEFTEDERVKNKPEGGPDL